MQFLGIKVDEVSKEQALQKAVGFLSTPLFKEGAGGGQFKIFTPNPEMIVKAQKDEYFKKVLNSGDLNLCDGIGLWLAIRFFAGSGCHPERAPKGDEGSLSVTTPPPTPPPKRGADRDSSVPRRGFGMTKKVERIPGIDFMLELCKLATEQGRGVYLLGAGNDEVVGGAFQELEKKYPNLIISGYNKGPTVAEQNPSHCPSPCRGGNETTLSTMASPPIRGRTEEGVLVDENNSIIEQINQSGAQILFVAFGMGKQEKWIYENLHKIPNVKIAMGVGGSFDFISGHIKRAPLFLRHLGLEWLYRLVQQPSRIGRIFNATLRFSFLAIKSIIYEKKV